MRIQIILPYTSTALIKALNDIFIDGQLLESAQTLYSL